MTTLRQRLTRALDAQSKKGVTLGSYDITIERDLRVPMDDGVELLADLIRPDRRRHPIPSDDRHTRPLRSSRPTRGLGSRARVRGVHGALPELPRHVGVARASSRRRSTSSATASRRCAGCGTQPWFTGHLATYGESYMGYTQWAVAGRMQLDDPENAPEALVLVITMPDFGAITWDNGAFALRNALGWTRMMHRMRRGGIALLAMALPDPKLDKAFGVLPLSAGDSAATGEQIHWYQDWVRHENLGDEYWNQQSHTASVADVTAPVSMITGWFDIFLPWQLDDYAHLVEAGRAPRLIIGPWGHTSPGMTAPKHIETIAFLKETFSGAPASRPTLVRAFETGADVWHDLETWPPAGSAAQDWNLHSGGVVSTDISKGGVTSYTYDPDEPTPAVGGPSLLPKTEPVDNREHEKRDDVAVFRSPALSEPLEIAGQPVAASGSARRRRATTSSCGSRMCTPTDAR